MNNEIKQDSPLSLYYQLKQIIKKKIENGEYQENDKLPSESELCERYDISRATVRQALTELQNEDYIYKVHGKGSYVSSNKLEQDLLKFYSFTNEMKKIGKEPSSKVIDFELIKCDQKIAEQLQIEENEKVYKFIRLRLADNVPMMLEYTYLPYKEFADFPSEELDYRPLYDILTINYNVSFSKAEEIFRATLLREYEAGKLNCVEGGPGILLERITYDINETIIEYTKSISRGDKFKYHVVLEK
ncbi:MAG: GntR family transcriptional regulator [Halanaerobiales bacterium]|nr:GntR family transcriptional regulator [Halanaerobiales bacterium]